MANQTLVGAAEAFETLGVPRWAERARDEVAESAWSQPNDAHRRPNVESSSSSGSRRPSSHVSMSVTDRSRTDLSAH